MPITPEARNFIDDLFARTDGDTKGATFKMALTDMAASVLWAWREPTPSLVSIGNPEIRENYEVLSDIMESYKALNDKNLARTLNAFGDLPDGRRGVLPSFCINPSQEMISIAISFGITGETIEDHFSRNKI